MTASAGIVGSRNCVGLSQRPALHEWRMDHADIAADVDTGAAGPFPCPAPKDLQAARQQNTPSFPASTALDNQ